MTRLLPLAAVLAATLGWSDPVPIASTSTAAPPAVAVVDGRVHVFWLDRSGPTAPSGDLWHAVLSPDGRVTRSPSQLRSGVDIRLAFPVAVPWAGRVAAAWMTRTGQGVRLEIATLTPDGDLLTIAQPDAVPREEAGRVALAASADGVLHAAWSQFDQGQRRIWYTRVAAPGLAARPPLAVTAGDAPALMVDPEPRLLWWEGEGAAGFRLMMGSLGSGRLTERRALTGTIALVYPLPVLPATLGGEGLLMIPTLERAFATSGRLYAMRIGPGEAMPDRVSVLGQTRVADVSLAQQDGVAAAVWSQAVGRRQNSELHAARLLHDAAFLEPPSRLTYTIPGSLKPAVAVVAGQPAAVWLEVTGFAEFSLSFGTSAAPKRHRFVLGIPELDLFRPGAFLAFALLAAASVLPIALVLTATTLLPAAALMLLARLLIAPFARLDSLLRKPAARLVLVLIATALIQVVLRGVIPGRPPAALLVLPLALLSPAALGFLARREVGPLVWGLAAVGVVFIGGVVVLLPWGAAQLSQF